MRVLSSSPLSVYLPRIEDPMEYHFVLQIIPPAEVKKSSCRNESNEGYAEDRKTSGLVQEGMKNDCSVIIDELCCPCLVPVPTCGVFIIRFN